MVEVWGEGMAVLGVLEFVVANLLVIIGALSVVRCLRWRGMLYAGAVATVWYFSQVVFSLLFAGVVLRSLTSGVVLAVNVVIMVAVLCVARRWGRPFDRKALVLGWHTFVGHLREVFHEWWVAVLVVLALADAMWLAVLGFVYPTYGYDAVNYHLVGPATWLQTGTFSFEPFEVWSNVYPQDVETYFTWLILFLRNDVLVNMGQLVFALGGMLAVIGIARLCGLRRPAAVGAGCLFFLTPILIAQVTTNYVDVAFASLVILAFYFVLSYAREPKLQHLFFFGLAAGLTLGSKSSAVSFVGVDCVVLVGAAIYHRKLNVPYLARGVALVLVPLLLLGVFWYVRAWVGYGNPIYPVTVSVLGHTIFAGQGSVQSIILSGVNDPSAVAGKPLWQQMWTSWSNDPVLKLQFGYTYDQRLGGFGPQWLLLEVPALLAYGVYTARKQRTVLLAFLVPCVVVFLAQPALWWSRFVLFLVAPGAIALAFFLERSRPAVFRVGVQVVALVFVLASFYASSLRGDYSKGYVVGAVQAMRGNLDEGFWFSEDRWVNAVPAGSRIGWVKATLTYNIFALYGPSLQNRVYALPETSAADFFAQVQADKITYLFTGGETPAARWAAADPQEFHIVSTFRDVAGNTSAVYKVTLLADTGPRS